MICSLAFHGFRYLFFELWWSELSYFSGGNKITKNYYCPISHSILSYTALTAPLFSESCPPNAPKNIATCSDPSVSQKILNLMRIWRGYP